MPRETFNEVVKRNCVINVIELSALFEEGVEKSVALAIRARQVNAP